MKKRIYWLTLFSFLFTAVIISTTVAQEKMKMKHMKSVTLSGTLIDTKCYGMNNDNMGTDHMTPKGKMSNCAAACAKMGIPVGLLIDGKKGGEVIFLVTPSMQLASHMAKKARVTGHKAIGGLIPEKIEVMENGKWKEVKFGTMM